MPRPRQVYNDCVVAVFREITGADENTALGCFAPYLKRQRGIPLYALSACLTDAGWMLTVCDYAAQRYARPDRSIDNEAFKTFWEEFQGEAVLSYSIDDAEIGHTVVVRSGGIVFDPDPVAPEDGESIVDHIKRIGRRLTNISVSTVTRMLPR